MILVDTSVWIDFFTRRPGAGGRELQRLIARSEALALTGLIVTEVLQGLTRDVEAVERYLALWNLIEPRGLQTYRRAASLHRLARSRSVTLGTVDALVATLALENGAALFSLDKDFKRLAAFAGLTLHPSGLAE